MKVGTTSCTNGFCLLLTILKMAYMTLPPSSPIPAYSPLTKIVDTALPSTVPPSRHCTEPDHPNVREKTSIQPIAYLKRNLLFPCKWLYAMCCSAWRWRVYENAWATKMRRCNLCVTARFEPMPLLAVSSQVESHRGARPYTID